MGEVSGSATLPARDYIGSAGEMSTGINGIEIVGTAHRASVRNGSIKGFSYGVRSILSNGISARGCVFRDLGVSSCTAYGIYAGSGAVLESCRAHDNTGTAGSTPAAVRPSATVRHTRTRAPMASSPTPVRRSATARPF